MRQVFLAACALTALLLFPAAARAQATIAGVVKDASGAVLPGVTVEVASPVLIEKTRSAVITDGTGQYRIINLLPGTYTVTFTLTGFSTIKREVIDLSRLQ
jgi:protocatechuate 3,4-dioxygenase beta subunit